MKSKKQMSILEYTNTNIILKLYQVSISAVCNYFHIYKVTKLNFMNQQIVLTNKNHLETPIVIYMQAMQADSIDSTISFHIDVTKYTKLISIPGDELISDNQF